jgi:hypothetical protein
MRPGVPSLLEADLWPAPVYNLVGMRGAGNLCYCGVERGPKRRFRILNSVFRKIQNLCGPGKTCS